MLGFAPVSTGCTAAGTAARLLGAFAVVRSLGTFAMVPGATSAMVPLIGGALSGGACNGGCGAAATLEDDAFPALSPVATIVCECVCLWDGVWRKRVWPALSTDQQHRNINEGGHEQRGIR